MIPPIASMASMASMASLATVWISAICSEISSVAFAHILRSGTGRIRIGGDAGDVVRHMTIRLRG
jgi:hypothetical protein